MLKYCRALVGLPEMTISPGCTRCSQLPGINQADAFDRQIDAVALPALPAAPQLPSSVQAAYDKRYRDRFVKQWMTQSDILRACDWSGAAASV